MERTLIIIKPDAVQRGFVGEIIGRFERKGLKIVGLKMLPLNDALLSEHYSHLKDKPFFDSLKRFMKSTPVIILCVEGVEVVDTVRLLCGITKARSADVGSIRGDLAMSQSCNVIHASDTVENAKNEIQRFFEKDELFDYDKTEYLHVYAEDER
ncbi:nucleoside-diphosphate kinase [Candidatus Peregrinibacteria bacterium]|nr:nucleoside-diphosphate kinase [Candidatus Peregrinibacteria bacterium]